MPDATTNLTVLVADTSYLTALTDSLIAEERAVTGQLQPAVAAVISLGPAADIAIAASNSVQVSLDNFLSGSQYLHGSLSLAVAVVRSVISDSSLAIAEPYTLTPALDVLLTDAVPIVLEPNDPKAAAFLTMTDLLLGQHPNVITSPTTDFETAGVRYSDVLEIYEGPNAGHYIIQSVQRNALFVGEAPVAPSWPGPWAGEIRKQRDITAQLTAALVIDQSLFFAPTVRYVTLEIVIV